METKKSLFGSNYIVTQASRSPSLAKPTIAWMFIEHYNDGSWQLWNELIAPTRKELLKEAASFGLVPGKNLKAKKVKISLVK